MSGSKQRLEVWTTVSEALTEGIAIANDETEEKILKTLETTAIRKSRIEAERAKGTYSIEFSRNSGDRRSELEVGSGRKKRESRKELFSHRPRTGNKQSRDSDSGGNLRQ